MIGSVSFQFPITFPAVILDSKPKIQRRHSLHSPTCEPRHPMKQLSSFDSGVSHRPQSMLIDLSTDKNMLTGTDELAVRTLQIPNGKTSGVRSESNQNLASSSGLSPSSFAAQTHTCSGLLAPTTSQLQVAFASTNPVFSSTSSTDGRPTLIKQFSQASSCAADSPSPVERDGVLSSGGNSLGRSDSGFTRIKPVEIQCRVETDGDLTKVSSEKKTAPLIDMSFLGTSLRSSVPHQSKMAPSHSNSNPEFPLTAHISMSQTERTHSFDDIYEKQRQPRSSRAHAEAKVSPSREKINSLSSQIYTSLDQKWPAALSTVTGSYHHILKGGDGNIANPICEVIQKIINVTTPLLHFNQAHIQTLMQLSRDYSQSNEQDENKSLCSYPSLNSTDLEPSSLIEGDTVYDSPIAFLLSLGYRMVEKPLTVTFGVPCEGYMTLTFRLIDESIQNKDALLKVMVSMLVL